MLDSEEAKRREAMTNGAELLEKIEALRREIEDCLFEIEAVADMSIDAACGSGKKDFTSVFSLILRLSKIAHEKVGNLEGLCYVSKTESNKNP